jgi:hypothetical protein
MSSGGLKPEQTHDVVSAWRGRAERRIGARKYRASRWSIATTRRSAWSRPRSDHFAAGWPIGANFGCAGHRSPLAALSRNGCLAVAAQVEPALALSERSSFGRAAPARAHQHAHRLKMIMRSGTRRRTRAPALPVHQAESRLIAACSDEERGEAPVSLARACHRGGAPDCLLAQPEVGTPCAIQEGIDA